MSHEVTSKRVTEPTDPSPIAPEGPAALLVEPAGDAPDPSAAAGSRGGRFRFSGSLRVRAARGTLVNTGFLVSLMALNLIRAFVLAGLVSRSDYGLWGILVISLGTIMWLKQIGIGDKFIQQDEPDQEAAFQKAFTMELVLTSAFVGLVAVALPLVAAIYGSTQLILPGLVILGAFVVAVFQAPLWVFYRRMEFGRQRLLQALDPVVAFVASVALGVAGAGYWAFVGGFFAGVAATTVGAVLSSPYRFGIRFDRATLRDYASFSWPLFVAGGAALIGAQAAFLTARWDLGIAAAGAMTLATSVTVFADRADTLITETLYPAVCAVKDRIEILAEAFVKSNRLALMWAVPFGAGLSLFASDLVRFGIGERWQPAVVVLQVVGIAAAVNHIGFNWTAFLRARGQTRPIAVASVAGMLAFLVVGVPLILAIGLPGFAIGLAAQTLGQLVVRAFYLQRLFKGFRYLAHIARAFLPTIPAVAVVLAVRAPGPGEPHRRGRHRRARGVSRGHGRGDVVLRVRPAPRGDRLPPRAAHRRRRRRQRVPRHPNPGVGLGDAGVRRRGGQAARALVPHVRPARRDHHRGLLRPS